MDLKFISFDLETSGADFGMFGTSVPKPEYALQPWRVKQNKAFITTWAYCRRAGNKPITSGVIGPQINKLRKLLQRCIDEGYRIGGWNISFDVAWLIAYGLEDLVFKLKWIDGMRLWRHYFLEPGYDRSKKPY